jgi:hypothetical protein
MVRAFRGGEGTTDEPLQVEEPTGLLVFPCWDVLPVPATGVTLLH